MLTDVEVGTMVRAALDEVNEPAPWLSAMVRHELQHATKGQSRLWPASVAAAVIAALTVGLITAIHSDVLLLPATQIGPSQDGTVVSYRVLVDADVRAVDRSYTIADCSTRARCLEDTAATRDATRKLLHDLSVTPPPQSLDSQAELLNEAATRFLAHLDTALTLMANSNDDYLAASSVPDITDLDLAAARIDCWPIKPVVGDHGISCS